MSGELVSEDDLKIWLDLKRTADVETWCKARRIPYFHGKAGKICTTASAINGKLTGGSKAKNCGEASFIK